MNTYVKQYVRNCILNRKAIPSVIRKEIYIKLLELYESGLNNWVEVFEKDDYKTKKEKHRLNVHKKLLLELNKVVDR